MRYLDASIARRRIMQPTSRWSPEGLEREVPRRGIATLLPGSSLWSAVCWIRTPCGLEAAEEALV